MEEQIHYEKEPTASVSQEGKPLLYHGTDLRILAIAVPDHGVGNRLGSSPTVRSRIRA